MTWGERLENIYVSLNENGFQYLGDQMVEQYTAGGTSGEIFSIACTWLAKIRNNMPAVYKFINNDAEIILNEGIKIKYFTEDYYRKQ